MATAKKDDITRLVKIKLFKDKDKYSGRRYRSCKWKLHSAFSAEWKLRCHIMWLRYCVILKKQTRRQKQRFLS